jgi:hypothetical protein
MYVFYLAISYFFKDTFEEVSIYFKNELHNSGMGKTGSKTKPFLMLKKAKQLFIKCYL